MTSQSLVVATNIIPGWNSWVPLPDVLSSLCLGYLVEQKTTYFPDGQIQSIAHYMDGKLHGEAKEWHEPFTRVRLKCHAYYYNGKKHGDWTYWYSCGDLHKKKSYIHGKRHGDWKKWFWMGKVLKFHVIYDHGKKIKDMFAKPKSDWDRYARDSDASDSDN